MKRALTWVLCVLLITIVSPAAMGQAPEDGNPQHYESPRKVLIPRQLRVQFVNTATETEARSFLRSLSLETVRVFPAQRLYVVRVARTIDVWTMVRNINMSPLVVYAVPDYILVSTRERSTPPSPIRPHPRP
jgi:hypothetical protein